MYEFKLPDVGEGIHEAEILAWLVKAGDTVKRDQPILEIQTDKAVVEIPSPVSGTIAEIRAEPGQVVTVGQVLVVIEAEGATEKPKTVAHTAVSTPTGSPQRVLAAPAVRKLALELGIDLTQVAGSGPAGRVLPSDVRKAAEQPQTPPQEITQPAPSPENGKGSERATTPTTLPTAPIRPQPDQETVEEEALHGLRRRIAERMEQAWQIPHVTTFDEVDVTNLIALRRHLQPEAERRGVRLTYLPFIIKATIQTLKEFPYFNASLDMANQKILLRRYYHIGVATAVPEGLLVPVIRHADQQNLLQLAGELSRLTEAARQRALSLAELSGSTFTITNFGSFGAQQGTPIINPPEVAILGCGRIEEKPVVREGQIVARAMLPLALSFDHRLIDGATAGSFLNRLKMLLADPNLLWLELI
ncbi:MAG: pyruvate dehydrogenase complex dihydrolipoyllysine-residue acetyltransferase [Anaerolineae bacterium]|nr:2-oxo acid dehydrogenase subunit E2 [Anaerolineales bacterium]MCQ3975373.1 dienelactone hydrolase [Anaerolineae bacterium]